MSSNGWYIACLLVFAWYVVHRVLLGDPGPFAYIIFLFAFVGVLSKIADVDARA